jgi:hypothetical protein
MHNVENIFKEIKGKYNLHMDKMNPKRGAWQKAFVRKGSLGQDLKEHSMRLEQEAMGGSPMTIAPSPVTYAAAAAASVSGSVVGPGVPPPIPVVTSEEATKEYYDFAQRREES